MIVSGYIADWGFKGLRPGDEKRMTHVNIAFALVKDGKCSVSHWNNDDKIRAFLKDRGSIKAVLSVGGWGAGGFSPAVATAESREIFAQSLVDTANEYGLDGVDLDWEYPGVPAAGIEHSPEDSPNYTELVRLLRKKLGPDKIVSMACGASQKCADALEIKKLAKMMDLFNIMTYDMCPWNRVSHHTALYASDITDNSSADEAIKRYEAAGVPREKLTLGAAFYAREYKNVDGLNASVSGGGHPGFSGGYVKTMQKAEQAGEILYDEKAEAAYAYDAKERTFLTWDSERSIKAKVEYVKKQGLAGIMFWEYSCDDGNSTLLKAMTDS